MNEQKQPAVAGPVKPTVRHQAVVAMVGGKNKTAIRNATPEPFRDLLLSIARQAHNTGNERPSGSAR